MKIVFSFLLMLTFCEISTAGISPTFNMTVKNIRSSSANTSVRDSIVTFEIWLYQTNQGQPDVDDLEYGAGQYTFRYNKEIHTPGGNLIVNLNSTGNELPASLRPPTIKADSVNGFIKLSGNLPQSLTNFFIPGTFPGSKLMTVRIRTNVNRFNKVPVNLSFKLGAAPNTFIAYMLPYPDSVDSEAFPNQFAVALLDTIVNQYSVESSTWNYQTVKINLQSLIEGKYSNVFNLLSKKDSVKVYLRNSTTPYTLKDSATGLIDSVDFSGMFTFNSTPTGRYYIVVKHYQGVETWSKAGGDSLRADSLVYGYDFTSSASQAFYNNLVLKGNKYCIYSGDVDQNGFINLTDVLSEYNDLTNFISGEAITDLNGDRSVDLSDLLICQNNCNEFIRIRNP